MALNTENNDLYINGNLACATFTPPKGCINDSAVLGNAQIQSSKLQQQGSGIASNSLMLFAPATTIATGTTVLGMAYAAGTLLDFSCWIEVAGTGGGMSVTLDLKKSTGAGAYASVLSAVITLNASTAIRTKVSATITSTAYIAGDIFETVVTATAGGGTLPTGLTVRLTAAENSQ